MSDLIKTVMPKNVATFKAVRMESGLMPEATGIIQDMAEAIGARVQGWTTTTRKGAKVSVLRVVGKNRKTCDIALGDWFLVLGEHGAMRACTDRQYKNDYKEIDE